MYKQISDSIKGYRKSEIESIKRRCCTLRLTASSISYSSTVSYREKCNKFASALTETSTATSECSYLSTCLCFRHSMGPKILWWYLKCS